MNHFLRHHNIKCLDTIPLYKNHICSAFWAPGDEKPRLKFAKYCRKSCKTSGSHFYPFSSIRNLQLKKSVFFFLVPIRIRIMNHLKWIFSNIFAFWIDISPFNPFLNSQKSCRKTSGSHLYSFSSIKNLQLKKSVFFRLLNYTYTYNEPSQVNIFKYFCILDWYIAHLPIFKQPKVLPQDFRLTFILVFLY